GISASIIKFSIFSGRGRAPEWQISGRECQLINSGMVVRPLVPWGSAPEPASFADRPGRVSCSGNTPVNAMAQSIALPKEVPVMPLPGALLFPHALLPLHIFEPRYREMLEHALREQRMFSVALLKPQRTDWKSHADFFHVAGLGLIRACVGRGDGTSNLILQGLQRVRFTGFAQEIPFPIAEVEALESESAESVEADALGAKVVELYSK